MLLTEIIKVLGPDIFISGDTADIDIKGLAYDSRKVASEFIFVAIPGMQVDGHAFITHAADKGAAAIIYEHDTDLPEGIPAIRVPDSRAALAAAAALFYNYPDRRMRLIGVTGTNGKTTTTFLIKWLLEQAGHKTGLIGTICNLAGDEELPASHTTPESLELFQLFSHMEQKGCKYIAMEVSSHALSQGRVSSCNFAGAVFTNLTQDHLDYHGTMESYLQSKVRLFRQLDMEAGHNRYGVININDHSSSSFAENCNAPVWTYGSNEESTLRLLHHTPTPNGTKFAVTYFGEMHVGFIPLLGKFNVYNALAAMAVALAEGIEMEAILESMKSAPQVPGRFELIDEGQDFSVVVDYAHTPDGLKNILSAATKLEPRRLISVFGCGGNRDKGKRPIMGRIAGAQSDVAIITSDNPRFEDPLDIIEQVEIGIKQVCNNYLVEENRERAVRLAINMAEAGDIVVVAGKGHETYQIIGDVKYHCDDRETARMVLKERMGKNKATKIKVN